MKRKNRKKERKSATNIMLHISRNYGNGVDKEVKKLKTSPLLMNLEDR